MMNRIIKHIGALVFSKSDGYLKQLPQSDIERIEKGMVALVLSVGIGAIAILATLLVLSSDTYIGRALIVGLIIMLLCWGPIHSRLKGEAILGKKQNTLNSAPIAMSLLMLACLVGIMELITRAVMSAQDPDIVQALHKINTDTWLMDFIALLSQAVIAVTLLSAFTTAVVSMTRASRFTYTEACARLAKLPCTIAARLALGLLLVTCIDRYVGTWVLTTTLSPYILNSVVFCMAMVVFWGGIRRVLTASVLRHTGAEASSDSAA